MEIRGLESGVKGSPKSKTINHLSRMVSTLEPDFTSFVSRQREREGAASWGNSGVSRRWVPEILRLAPRVIGGEKGAESPNGGGQAERKLPSNSARDSSTQGYHETVLRDEAVDFLQPAEGKRFFDGTLGGGGHSEALLEGGARVLGCDQDEEAIHHACARLASFGDRFSAVRSNFSDVDVLLADFGWGKVNGILLDLGVSSRHLDAPERGFSFRNDGPLDMRMDVRQEQTAADLINGAEQEELARIFWEYGEERASRRIAKAIVGRREKQPFTRTADLAEVIASVLPRGGKKHPATRVFQAVRIAVNAELARLSEALAKAPDCLQPGGILAVITFHSLEDRIVKRFLRRHSEEIIDRPEWPAPKPNPDCHFRLPSRKPIGPTSEEQERNPRSRSAKLRVGIRL